MLLQCKRELTSRTQIRNAIHSGIECIRWYNAVVQYKMNETLRDMLLLENDRHRDGKSVSSRHGIDDYFPATARHTQRFFFYSLHNV